MKKVLMLLLVTGTILVLLFTGKADEDQYHDFAALSAVMNSGGVDLEEFYLEGWAVVRDTGTPSSFWKKNRLGERLELEGGEERISVTAEGELFQIIQQANQDVHLQAAVKEVNDQDEHVLYVMIECLLTPDLEKSLVWEHKIKDILSSLGREHGVYLTVSGKIDSPMDEQALFGFGKAIFNTLGADVTDTLCTDRYVSFTGYVPQLSHTAIVGREKINLNLAAVRGEQATRILLGTPLISCEY